jgi:hypothetical protein
MIIPLCELHVHGIRHGTHIMGGCHTDPPPPSLYTLGNAIYPDKCKICDHVLMGIMVQFTFRPKSMTQTCTNITYLNMKNNGLVSGWGPIELGRRWSLHQCRGMCLENGPM